MTAPRYLQWLARWSYPLLATLLSCAVFAGRYAASLEVRSSLDELLPPEAASVRALDRVKGRVGGAGDVLVVVRGPDPAQNRRFVDRLVRELLRLPPDYVRHVQHRAFDGTELLARYGLLYAELDDLRGMVRWAERERLRHSPFYLGLDEDEEPTNGAPARELLRRVDEPAFEAPMASVDGYLGGDGGRLLVVAVRSNVDPGSVDKARDLVRTIRSLIGTLRERGDARRLEVGLGGSLPSLVEEHEAVRHDIVSTGLLCAGLVALLVLVYFRSALSCAYLSLTLGTALVLTLCFMRAWVGHLNSQTAFLGAIIAGTGINYGVILLARHREELRGTGKRPLAVLATAIEGTWRPTLSSAITTMVAFGALALSGVRSLAQFGLMGAVGVLLCWLGSYTLLPLLVIVTPRAGLRVRSPPPARAAPFLGPLSSLIERRPRALALAALSLCAAALLVVAGRRGDAIEYDFSRLRSRTSETSGTDYYNQLVGSLRRDSTVSTIVYVDAPDGARAYCRRLRTLILTQPHGERRVGSCTAVADFLPNDQEAKLALIAKVRPLLRRALAADGTPHGLSRTDLYRVARLARVRGALGVGDLPAGVRQAFEDKAGRFDRVAIVSPARGKWLSRGPNLLGYADTLGRVTLAGGGEVAAAGDALVFADIVRLIQREAPRLTLLSLLSVCLTVVLLARSWLAFGAVLAGLLFGVTVMLGVAGALGMRLDFFNFMVLPLTIGIGADYALNVTMRAVAEPDRGMAYLLRHTGGAVALCSGTTLVGYGALTTAQNQALASFGKAAMIGELACLVGGLVVAPAVMRLIRAGRGR